MAPPALSSSLSALIDRGVLRAEGPIVGQFLGVRDGHLYGWAMSVAAPKQTLQVELVVDGVTSVHAADHNFDVMAALPPEVMRHGFALPLPSSRGGLLRRSAPPRYALRVAGSKLFLARGTIAGRDADLARHQIEGFCDASDNGVIYGWAWYLDQPERRVALALFIDDMFFAHVRADRDRDDLRHRGIGDGDYGFNITLPRTIREHGKHRIDVVVADLGFPLVRSPMQSEGLIVGVTPPRKHRRLWR